MFPILKCILYLRKSIFSIVTGWDRLQARKGVVVVNHPSSALFAYLWFRGKYQSWRTDVFFLVTDHDEGIHNRLRLLAVRFRIPAVHACRKNFKSDFVCLFFVLVVKTWNMVIISIRLKRTPWSAFETGNGWVGPVHWISVIHDQINLLHVFLIKLTESKQQYAWPSELQQPRS